MNNTEQNDTNEEVPPQKFSIINAFLVFTFSVWILLFTISFNMCTKCQKTLLSCDEITKTIFAQWIGKMRAGGTKDAKGKTEATESHAANTSSNAANSSNTVPAKRSASYVIDPPASKKANTKVATITSTPSLTIREVFIIFRAFRYHDELLGFAIWNSYMWKDQIDMQFGFPANAFLRTADIAVPHANLPPIMEANEANTYIQTNNATEVGRTSLAHLLLFSIAERSRFHFNSHLTGFHFITKRGMDQVPIDHWLDNNDGNYHLLTPDQLTHELNQSNIQCQEYLLNICAATHHPATPGQFMGAPAKYTLIRQRRNIPEGSLELFDRLLNYARGNVSRHTVIPQNIVPVEIAGGPV